MRGRTHPSHVRPLYARCPAATPRPTGHRPSFLSPARSAGRHLTQRRLLRSRGGYVVSPGRVWSRTPQHPAGAHAVTASLGCGESCAREPAHERRGNDVDLYEYQGRELFARHGLPVLGGGVADDPGGGPRRSPSALGGRVVVKAQVKVGGRGKAGGVKLADDAGRGAGARRPTSSAWTSRATPSTR